MSLPSILTRFAADCDSGALFGIPTWYKYLPKNADCSIDLKFTGADANPNDAWLILLGVIDILLYVGGVVAVGFVVYAGVMYMASQGEPDKTNQAKNILLNAVIGLIICLIAIPLVSYIGSQF